MDEQKTTSSEVTESTDVRAIYAPVEPTKKASSTPTIIAGIVALALIGGGVWYYLEQTGKTSTGVFSGLTELSKPTSVATVNGVPITRVDYDNNVRQLTEGATAQGLDMTDVAVTSEISTQALDTLVNTELLVQAAVAAGVTVDEGAVDERLAAITEDLGGPEAFAARVTELGLTDEMVRRDIGRELTIQDFLTQKVGEIEITVTDEEVQQLYDSVGGEEGGNPPLADIRDQVVAQAQFLKEQEFVQTYVEELRAEATIESTLE